MVDYKYFLAGFISLLIFMVGIQTGLLLSNEKVRLFENEVQSVRNHVDSLELEFLFIDVFGKELSCEYLNNQVILVGNEADRMGALLSSYDASRKLDEPINTTKEDYMSVLIREWLYFEKVKGACHTNATTVVYFYSNNACPDCREQGVVLTYFKQSMKDKLMVFPIDLNVNLPIIQSLRGTFGIAEVPTIVVNGVKYPGFVDKDRLGSILTNTTANP